MRRFILWWTKKPKITITFITLLLMGAVYVGTNRMTPIFEPIILPFLFGEEHIPLILGTIPIYLSIFIIPIIFIALLENEVFYKVMLVLCIITLIHGLFFFFLPTTYPRNYSPIDPNEFLGWVYQNLIVFLDEPKNCLPSMHVSIPFFISFVWLQKNKVWGRILLIWSVIILVSTLTTKQHYLLDGVVSILLSFLCYKFIYKKLNLAAG